jgi:hypothetical protein
VWLSLWATSENTGGKSPRYTILAMVMYETLLEESPINDRRVAWHHRLAGVLARRENGATPPSHTACKHAG